MSKTIDREKAVVLRKSGKSYSEIRSLLKVSKSTLSLWLRDCPLSDNQLRALSESAMKSRVEKTRQIKKQKREANLERIYRKVGIRIHRAMKDKDDIFLAGLFLYWGEGTKRAESVVALTNTDPAMLKFFVGWLESLGVSRDKLKIKLHLYSDMDKVEKTKYWAKQLGVKPENFWKPYIKESSSSNITYKTFHSHGTCTVSYGSAPLYKEIMMGIRYLQNVVPNEILK